FVSVLAAQPSGPKAWRNPAGPLRTSGVRLWRISANCRHGHPDAQFAGTACATATHALSATGLYLHGAGRGRADRPLHPEDKGVALGRLLAGLQRLHVRRAMGTDRR